MIRQHYTASSRRAMNVIWNAAEDYDFDSPFEAFFPNGDPDYYFDLVIGLSQKWLDLRAISDFLDSLGNSSAAGEASSVLWLGLENCVYEKELPERPILSRMRKERAEAFFHYSSSLSRQQMMLTSMRVYSQEEARWSKVLGRKVHSLSPREMQEARELEFPGSLDTGQILHRMKEIAKKYFHLTAGKGDAGRRISVTGLGRKIAGAFLGSERRNIDLLVLRRGNVSGDEKGSVHLNHNIGELHISKDPERDLAYIRSAFGECLFSEKEMRRLENFLCSGDDAGCRLWFASPALGMRAGDREGKKLQEDQLAQRRRNETYYRDNIFRIKESIRNLSAQTDTIFSSYLRALPEKSRRGKIQAEYAWQLPVFGDGKVFLAPSDTLEVTVSVDLLLDASQSRMNAQEVIASQAFIIAKSFEACHIPVRVSAFRSLRGFTVIQRLKEYGDRLFEGIFGYYAAGWNRDGLCLKALDYLLEEQSGRGLKKVLLVLTDANPNDSVPLGPQEGKRFSREYEGEDAVESTAKAVRQLRAHQVSTSAVYYGSSAHLDNVHRIYGQGYVRVLSLTQLSDAVAALLKRSLQESSSDIEGNSI